MMYNSMGNGLVSVMIQTLDTKCITNQNVLINEDKTHLREMVRNFFLKEIKKMKPDNQMITWNTSVGEFTIHKESSLDYTWKPDKSKYNTISTKLEIVTKVKGKKRKIRNIIIKSRKVINKDYEGFDDCPNCFEKGLLDYTIVRQDGKITVCKKCKDFDKLITKLGKQIDEEKKLKKTLQTKGDSN